MTNTKELAAAWTPERVETATARWREGWSATQISKVLGLSRNAVMGKIHRLGLSARDQPSEPGKRHPKANPLTPRPKAKKQRPALSVVPQEERIELAFAWKPVPGSTPRPWEERGNGCKWPIDVPGAEIMHACCQPKDGDHPNYCRPHRALSVSRAQANAKMGAAYVRSLRKFAA